MDKLRVLLILIVVMINSVGCKRDYNMAGKEAPPTSIEPEKKAVIAGIVEKPSKIGHVNFYIENSESMFGYVKSFSNYVEVISELAEKPQFAEEKTPRNFYFVNGGEKLKITHIGDNHSDLKQKLNIAGFKCGDYTQSNLTSMFQMALKKAKRDTISILISDALYDVGGSKSPMNTLSGEVKETRSRFIERLGEGDLQTIMVKLYSNFDGYYFPVTGGQKTKINQTRPFYIWIFGGSEVLNKYFPENYLSSLKGYSEMARFLNFKGMEIPFQLAPSQKKLGTFKPDKSKKHKLIDVQKDFHGQGFQFSFAVDFSSLPFSDTYYKNSDNYSCTGNYSVTSVNNVVKKIYEVTEFKPTHIVTVSTKQNPLCELVINLNSVVPEWINTTSTDDESNIKKSSTQTFGFRFLTDAISEAYSYKTKGKNIASFNFEITK